MDLKKYVGIRDYSEVDPQDKRRLSITNMLNINTILMANRERDKKIEILSNLLPDIQTYIENKPFVVEAENLTSVDLTHKEDIQKSKIEIESYRVVEVIAGRGPNRFDKVVVLSR